MKLQRRASSEANAAYGVQERDIKVLRKMTLPVTSTSDLRSWQRTMRLAYSMTRCEPIGEMPFAANLSKRAVGAIEIGRISSSPLVYRRSASEIHQNPIDNVVFLLLVSGSFAIAQRGQEMMLRPGDIGCYEQGIPFDLHIARPYSAITLSVPRSSMMKRGIAPHNLPQIASGTTPNGHLAARVMQEIITALDNSECEGGSKLLEALLDIYSVAMPGSKVDAADALGASLIDLIEHKVRLDDPDLDLAEMASLCGVSRRTLNRAFAPLGTTPIRWLWGRRLSFARDLLANRRVSSVTEASLLSGFKDVSHFSRAYRSAFGRSPSSVLRRSD